MNKRILNILSLLLLSNNLASNVYAHNEQESSSTVSDKNNARRSETLDLATNTRTYSNEKSSSVVSDASSIGNDGGILINNSSPYKFEQTWVKVVKEIINSSNNRNKLDIKDESKNTYKNAPCYMYSVESTLTPGVGGGGAIYYDGGYFSFNEFKTEVFKSILRQFISNRAKYLCGMSNNSLEERKELKEIIDVLVDNDFDNIISRCVDINDIKLTLIQDEEKLN